MIGSDIWNCREKHFEQRVQLLSWKEKQCYCRPLRDARMMPSDERMAQWTPCKSFSFLTKIDGKLEAIYLSSYEWKVSLQVTLDFFFFVDVDAMFKVTNSESYVMTIIIDHKKQRCHDDGAVYFMHSMAPCIL